MSQSFGTLIGLAAVLCLMALSIYWSGKKFNTTDHFQLMVIQQTRTAIALVTTFTLSYCVVNNIDVADWFPPLYGVILALYFKGDSVILSDPAQAVDGSSEGNAGVVEGSTQPVALPEDTSKAADKEA